MRPFNPYWLIPERILPPPFTMASYLLGVYSRALIYRLYRIPITL